MKPAPFKYFAPESCEEIYDLLKRYGFDARILAGGQSLVPLMNMRILQPAVIISLHNCDNLSYIQQNDGHIEIGALSRQGEVEDNQLVGKHLPLLHQALPYVGARAIRNCGTVCGSLAHADPLSELPSVASALDATFVIASVRGKREVGAAEFFVSALTNCLEPDEMLQEVRFPTANVPAKDIFLEIANRAHGAALVGIAARMLYDDGNKCQSARIAVMGTIDTTVRLPMVEEILVGKELTVERINEASDLARNSVETYEDIHASSDYRRQMIGTLVKRALQQTLDT